jgi:hypothetical protein
MKPSVCTAPIEFSTLVEYWLDELDEAADEQVDEHILGCDSCSARLAEIVELGSGIRQAMEAGDIRVFVTSAFVKRLAARGVRVREYRVAHNGSVNCSVGPEDQIVVAHLEAPLEGVRRVDVISQFEDNPAEIILDVPFDATSGEVVISPRIANLRVVAPHRHRLRLVAVEPGAQRVIGDYTFNHAPAVPST